MDRHMAVGTKCEDLCITCQHPLENSHQRRDTKQPSRQNDLDSWYQQPVIDYMGSSILGPEICPTRNKHILQVWVCLSCLQDPTQNHWKLTGCSVHKHRNVPHRPRDRLHSRPPACLWSYGIHYLYHILHHSQVGAYWEDFLHNSLSKSLLSFWFVPPNWAGPPISQA